jgi:hypothetical protein
MFSLPGCDEWAAGGSGEGTASKRREGTARALGQRQPAFGASAGRSPSGK